MLKFMDVSNFYCLSDIRHQSRYAW